LLPKYHGESFEHNASIDATAACTAGSTCGFCTPDVMTTLLGSDQSGNPTFVSDSPDRLSERQGRTRRTRTLRAQGHTRQLPKTPPPQPAPGMRLAAKSIPVPQSGVHHHRTPHTPGKARPMGMRPCTGPGRGPFAVVVSRSWAGMGEGPEALHEGLVYIMAITRSQCSLQH